MGLRINYNAAAVHARLNMEISDRLLSSTIERLSTGLRINRAVDDPGGLIQANAMRHHLRGLDQATENAEDAINMLQTAESAFDEISLNLNRLRELAISAANEGPTDTHMLDALQAEFDSSVESIQRIAETTQFGQLHLLDGTMADNTLGLEAREFYASLAHDDTQLPDGIQPGSTITVDPPSGPLTRERIAVTLGTASPPTAPFPPVQTPLNGLFQGSEQLAVAGGETVSVTGPRGSTAITLSASTTISEFVSLVNASADETGARADYDADSGALVIESLHFGSGGLNVESPDLTAGASTVGLLDDDTTTPANGLLSPAADPTVMIHYTDGDGLAQSRTLTLDPLQDDGLTFTDGAFSLIARDTTDGELGSTIALNTTAVSATRETSFHLQTGALANQRVPVEIPDMRPGALGHDAEDPDYPDLLSLALGNALENGDAQKAIQVIDAAIDEVTVVRGHLGGLQANGLESAVESLRVSIENLTAAESRIRDADFAKESAEFARHNVMMNAATAMLAQANQRPNSILQLLQ